jgi:hypothetical protein
VKSVAQNRRTLTVFSSGMSGSSSVGIATGHKMAAGLYSTVSRPALGPPLQ